MPKELTTYANAWEGYITTADIACEGFIFLEEYPETEANKLVVFALR
jgi:hypothetical protein